VLLVPSAAPPAVGVLDLTAHPLRFAVDLVLGRHRTVAVHADSSSRSSAACALEVDLASLMEWARSVEAEAAFASMADNPAAMREHRRAVAGA
jgi:hypothetical protein